MAWVLDHSPTKGSDRLVLISIANHAGKSPIDGAWEAWPGIRTIQREAGLDRTRTVNDALARLVAAGAVDRIVNGAPDARIRADQRPNLYRILIANGVTCDDRACPACGVTPGDERGDALRHDGVTRGDRTGCRDASPEPSVEPELRTELQPEPLFAGADAPARANGNGTQDAFDRFWQVYPRRAAKGQARKAFAAALRKVDAATVVAGAERYRDDPNRDDRYTAHAATWLNGERWDDGPLPPRGRPLSPAGVAPARYKIDDDRDGPAGAVDIT